METQENVMKTQENIEAQMAAFEKMERERRAFEELAAHGGVFSQAHVANILAIDDDEAAKIMRELGAIPYGDASWIGETALRSWLGGKTPFKGEPRFIRPEEARGRLGVNEKTLARLVREGAIARVRLWGRVYRYSEDDVHKLERKVYSQWQR